MTPKLQLPVPKLGLSDDTARAEQPPQTTRRAKNVRLIDPRTGRSRIAQRSGMRKFWTNSKGGRIDYVAVVPYNAPKIEYTQLTESDNGTTDPALLTEEWSQDLQDFGRAVRTDFQGNVYVLLDDGRVQVWNADGTLLDTITPPLKEGEETRQGFAVDESRRVYLACVSSAAAQSKVFQWVRVEDPEREDFFYYDLRWTLEVEGEVQEITVKAGTLWLHRNLQSGESLARVTRYGALGGTTPPILERDTPAPYPIRDHAVSDEGEVYISCPSNSNRGAAPDLGGLHQPITSWTAHALGYDAAALDEDTSSKHRLHAWVDAHYMPGATHGDFVSVVKDRRYVDTQNTAPGGGQPGGSSEAPAEHEDGPTDYTSRPLSSLHSTDPTHRIGPQYLTNALAGLPALYFSGTFDPEGTGYPGMVLRSNLNTGPNFKTDTTGEQSLGTDTDATNVTVGSTWTTIPGIGIVEGAVASGVMTVQLDGSIQLAGTAPITYEVRATKDTLPAGPAIAVNHSTGTHTINLSLPVNYTGDGSGTYGVQFRKTDAADTVTVLGATVTTTLELFVNEVLPDQDGLAPQQAAIVPGHQGTGGHGDNWTAVSSWRLLDQTRMRVMAYQKGNVHRWILLANARISGGTLSQAPGWIAFLSTRMSGGDSVQVAIPGDPGSTYGTWRGVSFSSDPDDDQTGGHVIVVIQCVRNFTTEAVNHSFFRVNGRAAGRFTIDAIEAWGGESMVVIGNKHRLVAPHPSDLFGPEVPFEPFDGFFLTWQTVLGSTSNPATTANDVPCTVFTSGGLPGTDGDESGSIDPTTWDDDTPEGAGSYTGSATEVERLEGGIAHDCGMGNILPNGNGGGGPAPFADHPFGSSANPPTGFSEPVSLSEVDRVLLSPRPILAKLASDGSGFTWAINGSGLGYGCVALPGRFVAAVGEKDALDVGNEDVVLRRVYDGGQTVSLATDDGAWVYEDTALSDTAFDQPQLVADDEGQVYWPIPQHRKIQKHRGTTGELLWTYTPTSPLNVRQIALEPNTPVWPDSADEEDRSPIFLYFTGDGLRKLRMVAETQVIGDSASPRQFRYIAVSGTTLSTGDPNGFSGNAINGAFLFDADRTFIGGCTLFTKHYMADGRNVVVYDPLANRGDYLEANGRGELPKRPRLIASALGRIAVAHTQDDTSTVFMSAEGDAEDWDYFPVNPSATDAWNSTLGIGWSNPTDMITALIGLDDLLIIGGDHTIWKAVGNPRAGGRLHLVSDQTGISFGRAWCKDTNGLVYFYGSRGGVWRLHRGTDDLVQAQRVSEYRIERRLQDVNLAANRVELVWNHKDEGLWVVPIPYV